MSQVLTPSDQSSRIPLTVVSGTSGSGKSTLLRHLLACPGGMRLAAVVTDEEAIDPAMVVGRRGDLLLLRNGCACLIAEGDAATSLAALSRSLIRPEHVVIEASGSEDPRRFAGYGYMPGYCLDGTIAVVDATTAGAARTDPAAETRLHQQVAASSVVLLNKLDLVDDTEADEAYQIVHRMSRTVRVVGATEGRVSAPLVLGFGEGPGSLDDRVMFFPWSAEYWPGRTRGVASTHTGPRVRAERHRAWCLTSDQPIRAQAFRAWAQHMPPSILRARGCVHLYEEPQHRYEFRLFGAQWRLERGAPWADESRATRVLLAGLGVSRASTGRTSRARVASETTSNAGDAA